MFFIIPEQLLKKGLTLTDAMVYFVVDVFDSNGCDLENIKIARAISKSRSTINNSLNSLKLKGLIEDNGLSNEKRLLYVTKNEKDPTYIAGKKKAFKILADRLDYEITKEEKEIIEYSFIEFWNSLSNTRKHQAGTKIYAHTRTAILQLRRGTLYKNGFNDDWIKKKGVKQKELEKRYTAEEIHLGFKRLNMMCTPGYWPQDKKWIKGLGLSGLIYNPRAMNSWFIMAMREQPNLLIKVQAQSVFPKILDKCIAYLGNYYKDHDLVKINRGIKSLVTFFRSLPPKIHEYGDFANVCFDEEEFCKHYIKYLDKQDWITSPGANLFDIDSKMFRKYLDECWTSSETAISKNLSKFI